MALAWLEKMMHFFDAPAFSEVAEIGNDVVVDLPDDDKAVPESIELTDLAKIKEKFNEKTDILVVSEEYMKTVTQVDREWVESLLNIVIYFSGNSLMNVGVVTAPNYYSGYRG